MKNSVISNVENIIIIIIIKVATFIFQVIYVLIERINLRLILIKNEKRFRFRTNMFILKILLKISI